MQTHKMIQTDDILVFSYMHDQSILTRRHKPLFKSLLLMQSALILIKDKLSANLDLAPICPEVWLPFAQKYGGNFKTSDVVQGADNFRVSRTQTDRT